MRIVCERGGFVRLAGATRLNIELAQTLVDSLPASMPGLFNPWRQRCEFDTAENSPEQRLERLARHLDCDAKLVIVGEAPGYQGCRYSGIGFCSERLLLEGAISRIPPCPHRLSTRKLPFSEPSATIVWKALYRHGVAEHTILWNALQLHPFREETPWSNRTPSPAEIALGARAIELLRQAYPGASFVAVGRKAELALTATGVPLHAAIRHPANGGATLFAKGLAKAVEQARHARRTPATPLPD